MLADLDKELERQIRRRACSQSEIAKRHLAHEPASERTEQFYLVANRSLGEEAEEQLYAEANRRAALRSVRVEREVRPVAQKPRVTELFGFHAQRNEKTCHHVVGSNHPHQLYHLLLIRQSSLHSRKSGIAYLHIASHLKRELHHRTLGHIK